MSRFADADLLVTSLFDGYRDRLCPQTGREGYGLIRKVLRAEGYDGATHADDVFQTALMNALKYLRRHGPGEIRDPRAWFMTLCRRACVDYLQDIAVESSCTLLSLLEGEAELAEGGSLSDERELRIIQQAIKMLRPRHQQFVILDLLECADAQQICAIMQIPSNAAFRKLKHEAFVALREAIRALTGQLV